MVVLLSLGLDTKRDTSEKLLFLPIKADILFVVVTRIEPPINVVDISSEEKENLCNVSDSKNILIVDSTNTANITHTAQELIILCFEQKCDVIGSCRKNTKSSELVSIMTQTNSIRA